MLFWLPYFRPKTFGLFGVRLLVCFCVMPSQLLVIIIIIIIIIIIVVVVVVAVDGLRHKLIGINKFIYFIY